MSLPPLLLPCEPTAAKKKVTFNKEAIDYKKSRLWCIKLPEDMWKWFHRRHISDVKWLVWYYDIISDPRLKEYSIADWDSGTQTLYDYARHVYPDTEKANVLPQIMFKKWLDAQQAVVEDEEPSIGPHFQTKDIVWTLNYYKGEYCIQPLEALTLLERIDAFEEFATININYEYNAWEWEDKSDYSRFDDADMDDVDAPNDYYGKLETQPPWSLKDRMDGYLGLLRQLRGVIEEEARSILTQYVRDRPTTSTPMCEWNKRWDEDADACRDLTPDEARREARAILRQYKRDPGASYLIAQETLGELDPPYEFARKKDGTLTVRKQVIKEESD